MEVKKTEEGLNVGWREYTKLRKLNQEKRVITPKEVFSISGIKIVCYRQI